MSEPIQVRVNGDSMWPTYKDGTVLEFKAIDDNSELKVGQVVLSHHPLKKDILVVKRIHSIVEGRFFLVGDQPDPLASEDSHNFGTVSRSNIVACHVE
ncbi:MAG: nickel-type superoxide dismutase maturation protease [Euryarchaeota archaeon]|nr:nickel-type superoxide dismutase maturation protease [Euryarchaeota archaeon]|tara:strand:+ start:1226 stop:1519 length:294 start_codon:yes stop_codon:yes gene_type:complete